MPKLKTVHRHEYGKSRVTGVVTLEFDDKGISQELTEEQVESLSFSKSLQVITDDSDSKDSKKDSKKDSEKESVEATDDVEETAEEVTEDATEEEVEVEETVTVGLTEEDKKTELYGALSDSSMKEIKSLLSETGKVTDDVLKSFNRTKGKDALIQFAYPILKEEA